jgi:TnpA family transposase
MPPRPILSPQSRAALFDPPTDPAMIVLHYTFAPEDIAPIRQRRRAANRLGFGANLAYLRSPGRVLGADEAPPDDMLAFIATPIGCNSIEFAG